MGVDTKRVVRLLSQEERFKIVQKTYKEVVKCLNKYGACNMVRPTGFGKTYILENLSYDGGYDRVVYFSPRTSITEEIKRKYVDHPRYDCVEFMSLQKMSNEFDNLLNNKGGLIEWFEYMLIGKNLFIFDESHFCGATKWGQAIEMLREVFMNCHFLGATATPNRTDGVDVTANYFDNRRLSHYGLDEAMRDGLYPPPTYVYATFNIAEQLEIFEEKVINSRYHQKSRTDEEKIEFLKVLNAKKIEMCKFYNAQEVIKRNIDAHFNREERKYMKFMVFFPNYETMNSKQGELIGWFKGAYPTHKVNTLTIANDKYENMDTSRMDELGYRENEIDLIISVDKLSYGYHVADLSGIVMLRGTESKIVFAQQFGRVLNVASEKAAIVFDFVGNVQRSGSTGVLNVKPVGIRDEYGKRDKNWDTEFDKKHINLVDETKPVEEVIAGFDVDTRKLEDAVVEAYLLRKMPVENACRDLGYKYESIFYELLKRKDKKPRDGDVHAKKFMSMFEDFGVC